jgi:type VI secretion system protein ImpG
LSSKKYFEREYNFLQQEGEKFAEKHRAIGGQLRLNQQQKKDPFVERLFEGFAFLAGRVHERLDDDFPEITGGLLEQLFPHFLRPFPSCTILEMKPIPRALTKPVLVKRGSEIQTPTGKYRVKYKVAASPGEESRFIEKTEPAEFIFRTTQDVIVRPMDMKEVNVEHEAGVSSLIFTVQPHKNIDLNTLNLDNLVFYLQGPDTLRYILLLYLTKYVSGISIRELFKDSGEFVPLPSFKIGIPGLVQGFEDVSRDCSLIPYARQVFAGYRLLQEYFAFKDRFFFIELQGLESFEPSGEECGFEIKFQFNRSLSPEFRPNYKNIRLHCTPIVNLFDRPTEEIIVNQRLPEYYVLPDGDRRKSKEIYSINSVTGISDDKKQLYKYLPVTSYDIIDTEDPEYEFKRFYSIVSRAVKGDMAETYVRIFGPSMEEDLFPKETLSIEKATLSNGFLPSAYLEVGSINQPVDFPGGVSAENITAPTEVLECPDRQNYLWTLISHLTLSYASLADREQLKSLLSLYNWSKDFNNPDRKKIQSILRIPAPTTRYVQQKHGLIRGIEFSVEIDETQFENQEGDIHLFGIVLNHFLSQYVTINSFVILTILEANTKRKYTWHPKLGKILPI